MGVEGEESVEEKGGCFSKESFLGGRGKDFGKETNVDWKELLPFPFLFVRECELADYIEKVGWETVKVGEGGDDAGEGVFGSGCYTACLETL